MAISMQVTMDALDPGALGRFWALALGYREDDPPAGFASWQQALADVPEERRNDAYAVIDPEGVGPRVFFLKVPEPKMAKNKMHLDVGVGRGITDREQRAAVVGRHVATLVAAGATVVEDRTGDWGEVWTVMLDPEGNEFCVQ